MIHPRGWIVMCLVSAVLLLIVDLPVALQQDLSTRTIFVSIMTPVVWAIYLAVLYVFMYRPLRRSTDVYRTGGVCGGGGRASVLLWYKEGYKLNATLSQLRSFTADAGEIPASRQLYSTAYQREPCPSSPLY